MNNKKQLLTTFQIILLWSSVGLVTKAYAETVYCIDETLYSNYNNGIKIEIGDIKQSNSYSNGRGSRGTTPHCRDQFGNNYITMDKTDAQRILEEEAEEQGGGERGNVSNLADGGEGSDLRSPSSISTTTTTTTSCDGISDQDCQALHVRNVGTGFQTSGVDGAQGGGGDTNATNEDKKKIWSTCYKKDSQNEETFQACLETAKGDLKITTESANYRGTKAAQVCQAAFMKASNGSSWKDISTDIYGSGSGEVDYDKATAIFAVKLHGDKDEKIPPETIQNAFKKVAACNQLAAVFGENFEEDRDQEDPYTNPEKLTSLDGRITCKLSGLETLDYDECAALVVAHNSAEIGTAANNTFQQYEAQSLRSEQQQKLMNMDPNSNVTTAALKTQKNNLGTQQDMAEQRRALQAARLATIGGFSIAIPNASKFLETKELCDNPASGAIDGLSKQVKGLVGNPSPKELCHLILNGSKFDYFRNAEAKRVGSAIAAEAGVEVAAETMAVSQLGKQKRMIDGAIGKIEGMNTLELPEDFYQNEDVYMQFCTANPTHADCQSGFGATVNVPTFGDYNVGGFGANQAYQAVDSTDDAAVAGSTTSDPTTANVDTSTAVTKSSPGGGLKGRFGSGATVTEGGGLAQGAGGGGSNPGGGGGGGGSSAGAGGEQQGGVTAASGGTKGLSYVGGRGGPSFVGGRGIASKRSKKSDGNPFKNMFNKKKNRNLSSLNFKGKSAIGSKSDNLFQRISTAYDKANDKGNLLKYETKSIE